MSQTIRDKRDRDEVDGKRELIAETRLRISKVMIRE